MDKTIKGILRKSALVAGLWAGVALLISSITFLTQLQENFAITLPGLSVILFEIICISPWAVSTPFIVWIARRFSFAKNQLYSSLATHFLAAFFIFCFHSVIQSLAVSWFYREPFTFAYLMRDFWGFLDMRLLLYTGLLLGIYAIDFQKRNRNIRFRELTVKKQLNQAKFQALLNQIQPDFLLHSINMIEEHLERGKIEESEQILTNFSDLLRIMLNSAKRDEVTVQENIESFKLYAAILQKRVKQNFQLKTYIDDSCYEVEGPSFLMLIPIIEEMVQTADWKHTSINSFNFYNRQVGEALHTIVIIKGNQLPSQEIASYFEQQGAVALNKRLKIKYGNHSRLKIQSTHNAVEIGMVVPFLEREKMEDLSPITKRAR